MYKIMLADDEGIVIDSLKFIIEKEFKDICEVQYAKTGRSVIELAESFRPDIAVMDIQMPGINGIDAMKEIRRTNNHTVFIVMSAYDKFDYAKEAIKLGVMEYITKPMEKTRIVNALRKAMENIDAERLKRKNELLIKEKLETVVPIIESGLIHNILLQEHFREDIENYRSILGITRQYAYMIAVVSGDEQQGNHMTNAVGSSVRMQKHYQEVRDCLKEHFDCIVGTVMANKLAVLVPYEKEIMDYNERIELIEKARELVRYMRKRTDISFRIGIGGPKDFLMASESYTEALNALVASTGSVAHVDDLPIRCEFAGNYPVKLEKKLFAEIEDGDIDNASATAAAFFDWMTDIGSDLMNMRLKILEFVLWSEHIAYEKGGMTYQLNSRADYLPQVMEMAEPSAMKTWFLEKVKEACRNVLNKREEKSGSIIEMAKNYIKNNYHKDISLDDVSREVNISPYYFSKLFKETTGENFIEYLTNLRMDKAKELLETTECSMKEICVRTGYSDPNYFSRSFKKNVGSLRRSIRRIGEKYMNRAVCKMKKMWKYAAVVLVCVLTLGACGNLDSSKTSGDAAQDRKIQIGMSFDSFVIERWQTDRDIFVSTAKELGAEVNVQNANGDLEQQKKQINYFIDKGMDVIVIICIDSEGLAEQVQKAKEAGIKVIAYDRMIMDSDIDLYITFDNERVGTMMGEALVDNGLSGGKVLMLGGSAVDSNVAMVEKGFRKVMEDHQVTILDSMHADGWKAELAAAYVYDHMDVVSEADAIMCGNDDLASKVVHALKEKRMAGDIMVVGQDADLEACQRIVEGTQVMTVYKPVEKLAQKAAECAVLLAEGKELPEETVTIESGNYQVPYIGLEPISVDKTNINDVIIGSGFHLKEDVYLNVPAEMP